METKIEINDNITALQFFTKYNEQNVTGMLELFTNDAQITFLPLGENGIGKVSELGNSIWSQLVDCFPGISNKILKTKYDSEGNLICEITFAGNQKKASRQNL